MSSQSRRRSRLALATAIKASPSELVFPASNGSMVSEDANTERGLRSALARAGPVTGYDHTCRRCEANGIPHVERHADATLRHCPRCNMKLWPRPLKSKMRFNGLRHTAATLMLRAGVDPRRVQRILRHASVTTTTGTYAHLAIEGPARGGEQDRAAAVGALVGCAQFADTAQGPRVGGSRFAS
jgi:integrase